MLRKAATQAAGLRSEKHGETWDRYLFDPLKGSSMMFNVWLFEQRNWALKSDEHS